MSERVCRAAFKLASTPGHPDTHAAMAAGVASARYAVETIPTLPPLTLYMSSATVSNLGSSNGSFELSTKQLRALTVLFLPV